MEFPVPKDKISAISKRLETIFEEKDLEALFAVVGVLANNKAGAEGQE